MSLDSEDTQEWRQRMENRQAVTEGRLGLVESTQTRLTNALLAIQLDLQSMAKSIGVILANLKGIGGP